MKILIVEDEPMVPELLASRFEQQGFEVLSTDTGEGALELIRLHQPDVILLDLWLKGTIDGFAVLNTCQQHFSKTVVIVMTGRDEVSEQQVLRQGAFAFLKKPIRLEQLEELLRQIQHRPAPSSS